MAKKTNKTYKNNEAVSGVTNDGLTYEMTNTNANARPKKSSKKNSTNDCKDCKDCK